MAHPSSLPSTPRHFMLFITMALVTAALYFAQAVLIPVAVAILLTFILTPAVIFVQHRGIRRVFAVMIVLLLTFTFLGGVFWIVTLQVHDLSQEVAGHSRQISAKIAKLRTGEPGMVSNFLGVLNDIGEELDKASGKDKVASKQPILVEDVNHKPPVGLALIPVILRPLLEVLAALGLVLMLVIFMLIRREDLRNRLIRLIGHGRLMETTRALDEAALRISRYLLSQLAVNTTFGVTLGVGLFFIGVPYAFLWGFLAVIMRFVPYIGIWLSGLLPLTISVAISPEWAQPVMVAILYLTMEMITSNVIEPLVLSHSTGISATALLISAAFWTFLWGPIGLVLSAPLSVCLAVLGRYAPDLGFLDVLLGDEPVLEPKVRLYQRLVAQDQDEAIELVEEYRSDRTLETVYDELLLPVLLYAKRDRANHGLSIDDEKAMFESIRVIMDEVLIPPPQAGPESEDGTGVLVPASTQAFIMGGPAQDACDELALTMLAQLLRAQDCRTEVLASGMSFSEMASKVEEESPDIFVVASMPPGGSAQAVALCKKLHARFADLKIVVGRWGQSENVEKTQSRLQLAGANFVATSFLGTREQLLSIVETDAPSTPQTRIPIAAPPNAPPVAHVRTSG